MLKRLPAVVVAGTHSGCGKTSISLGLMAALRNRGLKVAPFKSGPDFIDPGFHKIASGTPSHNLDTWMLPQEAVAQIFRSATKDCDVAIIEGAMGLFDGSAQEPERGSSAHLAKMLNVPVVLVVDARGMGRSVAALVKGYMEYDPEITILGVIVNKVGSPRHRKILQGALEELGLPFLGFVERDASVTLPSRHLGLVTAQEFDSESNIFQALSQLVERNLDIEALLGAMEELGPVKNDDVSLSGATLKSVPARDARGKGVRIAVAWDKAFCFYYRRNLDLLEELGARLSFFSPLEDSHLPEPVHGLYLGGGYPELYGQRLSQNHSMLGTIRNLALKGLPVFAECGGFMYLGKGLLEDDGNFHPWCGVHPAAFVMEKRFQALGYREVKLKERCLLGTAGTIFRGHEFRYSKPSTPLVCSGSKFEAVDSFHSQVDVPCYVCRNIFASYIHVHFDSNPLVAASFVERCMEYQESVG
ncbi:MAG: cobyrinate a,c-diamide synthase [Thermodesulfobacteria bacterium]|nr:cobyrinate a,c-diamide synthase [Thermodesulfobacteriota bacterium]